MNRQHLCFTALQTPQDPGPEPWRMPEFSHFQASAMSPTKVPQETHQGPQIWDSLSYHVARLATGSSAPPSVGEPLKTPLDPCCPKELSGVMEKFCFSTVQYCGH